MMGLELVRIVSQKAWSEAWETSTSIPIRLHSRTTSPAEVAQPGLRVQFPAGVDPVESSDVGQRKDPDPHAVIHPQDRQIVVDPPRVEHGDHRNLAGFGDSLNVGGIKGQLHGIGVPPHALLQDLVDALEDPLDPRPGCQTRLSQMFLPTSGGSMIPSRASLRKISSTPIP